MTLTVRGRGPISTTLLRSFVEGMWSSRSAKAAAVAVPPALASSRPTSQTPCAPGKHPEILYACESWGPLREAKHYAYASATTPAKTITYLRNRAGALVSVTDDAIQATPLYSYTVDKRTAKPPPAAGSSRFGGLPCRFPRKDPRPAR